MRIVLEEGCRDGVKRQRLKNGKSIVVSCQTEGVQTEAETLIQ